MKQQRGAALLVALLILVLVATSALLSSYATNNSQIERDKISESALAQAKAALIAYATMRGDVGSGASSRPGDLPCPDTTDSGVQDASCTPGKIGRLPWKTLRIPELRDASGEHLWYAISGNFRQFNLNSAAINSDTSGSILLYAADGTSLLTPPGEELAAVIIAPGTTLAGQDRAAGPNSAANYLESANGRDNRIDGGPFIAGPVKDASNALLVNDRVLGISARELVSSVEKRALREAQLQLLSYLSSHGKYPNPASPSCTLVAHPATPNTCAHDTTRCFGRLPEDVFPSAPTWFTANGWGRVLLYAVNKNLAEDPSGSECTTSLQLDGIIRNYVLFGPGSARNGQTRPSANASDYLEAVANLKIWTTGDPGQSTLQTPPPVSSSQNDYVLSAP